MAGSPYPQQPYPYPGGGYGAPPQYRYGGGMATAALVLGILAIVTCITVIGGILLGILAIVLGAVAASRARRGEAPGRGRAIAGIVTGAIGLVLSGLLVAAGVSLLNSETGQELQQCLEEAGQDQAAIDQCQRELEGRVGG